MIGEIPFNVAPWWGWPHDPKTFFDDLFETVFSSGAINALANSICENLKGTSCKIFATDEYDTHDNLVYKPPPLDEFWLDAEGRKQSKIEILQQRKRNDELMRNCEVATKDMVPTSITQGGACPKYSSSWWRVDF